MNLISFKLLPALPYLTKKKIQQITDKQTKLLNIFENLT